MPLVDVEQCTRCGRKRGERHKAVTKKPSIKELSAWEWDGYAFATDGCKVEPDGICEHGHNSWLIVLGLI